MNMSYAETATGPCGHCGGRFTARVDVIFPITALTPAGPLWGTPIVLAQCTACGYVTRDLSHVIEGAAGPHGEMVLGIAGTRQPHGMMAYGELADIAALK